MNSNSKKLGTILSYLSVIATALANIVLVPFYMKHIGEDGYGLYQYIYSLAQYAMVLDFGISTVMIKYITVYKVNGDKKKEQNFAANALLIAVIAASIIVCIGIFLFCNIDKIIVNRTEAEMLIARQVFFFMIGRIIVALFQHYYEGALLGYERYAFAKGVIFIRIILRVGLIIFLVLCDFGIYGIVLGEFAASVLCLAISIFVTHFKTEFCIKWRYWDKIVMRQASVLIFALLLQSVVTYMNNVLDKYIVGSWLDNIAVTAYSIALQVSTLFIDLTTSVNSVFMPNVSRMIEEKKDNDALLEYIVSVGRLQCILCTGMLGGFVIFGKQFIFLWTGIANRDIWIVGIMLLASTALPLVQSTCLSVLAVKNKRLFRSVMLLVMAALHVMISIHLVDKIGIIGVAAGSAIATILGNGLIMNIYYKKVIKLDVIKMIRRIFSGILLAGIIALISCIPFYLWLNNGVMTFVIGVVCFCGVYAVALYFVALTQKEKEVIKSFLNKKIVASIKN